MAVAKKKTAKKKKPAGRKVADEVLLLHGMLLMCGADGLIEPAEVATIEAYVATLPEFRGKDFPTVLAKARAVVDGYESPKASVRALAAIKRAATRRKAFVLAVDIAMASGDVDATEALLLDAMRRVLKIDDALAGQIFDVMELKYAD